MGRHRIYNNINYEILSDIPARETGYLRQIRCRCPELLQSWDCCGHHAVRSRGMVTQSIIDRCEDELVSLTFLRNSFVCEECGASAIAWDPEYPPSESITPEAREFLAKQVIAEYYSTNRSDIVPLLKHYIQSGLECLTGTYRERFSDIAYWAQAEGIRLTPVNFRNRKLYIVTGSEDETGKDPFLLTLLPDSSEDTLNAFMEKMPEPTAVRFIMTELNDPILPLMRNVFPNAVFTYSKDSVSHLFEQYSGEADDPSRDARVRQAKQLFQRMFYSGSEMLRSEMNRWEDKMLLDESLTTRSRNLLRQLLDQLLRADVSALAEVPRFPGSWLSGGDIAEILRIMDQKGISYLDSEMMLLRSDASQYRTEGLPLKTGYRTDPSLLSVQYLEDTPLDLFLQM